MRHLLLFLLLVMILPGCTPLHAPKISRPSFIKTDAYPLLGETGSLESIKTTVTRSLEALSRLHPEDKIMIGDRPCTVRDLKETLSSFLAILEDAKDVPDLNRRVSRKFDLYEVPGPVLFTGYYAPELAGSLEPTDRFRYPLYRRPDDLNPESGPFCLKMLPFYCEKRGYFSRKEIDTQGKLSGRGLELLFLDDPVERFFLHVQGSGTVRLPDNRVVRVRYDGSNGRPYTSLGKVLINEGRLQTNEVTLPSIKAYLRLHPGEQEQLMNRNERYIFFKTTETGPQGAGDVLLTPYRSLATDPAVIPPGSLCYYSTLFPLFNQAGEPMGWQEQEGFAVSQDTGEAIRGHQRVDIFLGEGGLAAQTAGHLKSRGKLYILLRKDKDPF
ncbi:MAG: murein transglycosylase A [bacterium]